MWGCSVMHVVGMSESVFVSSRVYVYRKYSRLRYHQEPVLYSLRELVNDKYSVMYSPIMWYALAERCMEWVHVNYSSAMLTTVKTAMLTTVQPC